MMTTQNDDSGKQGWGVYWTYEQSGTKPNLVTKILATKFGVFFCYI